MSHPDPELKNLTTLRRLVTVLTVTMIIGITGIFILMAVRLANPTAPPLPEQITLPDGATATGFTQTPDYIAITTAAAILIYSVDGKTLRQTITLK